MSTFDPQTVAGMFSSPDVISFPRKLIEDKVRQLQDQLLDKRLAETMEDVCNLRGQIAAYKALLAGTVTGRQRAGDIAAAAARSSELQRRASDLSPIDGQQRGIYGA